jgi:2-polyprenyl-3-methyl-5-hydroxy-6-metoxy-1,4-benzoquinol methylase
VQLSSFDHIGEAFYRDSHMHDDQACDEELVRSVGLEDAARRFHMFSEDIFGKRVLDIGCGDGQFLALAKTVASVAVGCEPDKQWAAHHKKLDINVVSDVSLLGEQARFDVITMFHVLEHIPEPLLFLAGAKARLAGGGGVLIVEVPSANDALLTLYENRVFSEFTYWSCHLYLHTPETLQMLMEKAGFRTVELRQYQRYPLANHLYWLARGRPGGQKIWTELDDPTLNAAYARVLAEQGKCDTIIGTFADI